MIRYLPLEPYQERYTAQLAAPKTGWLERKWVEYDVPYVRYNGHSNVVAETGGIKTGVVVDAVKRSMHAMMQVSQLLVSAENGYVKPGDVIYLDDFWHPGVEAVPYVFDQLKLKCPAYAFCWAQSVDAHDFTFAMRDWIRPFETAVANYLSGIFVASTLLKELLVQKLGVSANKVHVVGLPFDSEEVMSRMPSLYRAKMSGHRSDDSAVTDAMVFSARRKNQVVFSSRWDKEKDPLFFLDVMEKVLAVRKDVTFVFCSSAKGFRSNDPRLILAAEDAQRRWPDNFVVRTGLTKEQYYATLCESKVQFNCAAQDWVSFTLLEASVAGCWPIYPDYRSFPETLDYTPDWLYRRWDVNQAAAKVLAAMDMNDSVWSRDAIRARAWVHERYDLTWLRMLDVMDKSAPVIRKDHELVEQARLPLYQEK